MTSKKPYKPYGLQEVSSILKYAGKQLFLNRGFAEFRIITDWDKIVGSTIGKYSNPRKLSFKNKSNSIGTLYIEAYNSSIALELEYSQILIIEKISTYFGYKAVGDIKIIQNPQSISAKENYYKKEITTTENTKNYLEDLTSEIRDPVIREKLIMLGKTVISQ